MLNEEVVGIWMAAYLMLKAPEVIQAVIFTDSQLAVRALNGEAAGASPLIFNSVLLVIRSSGRWAGGIPVRLQWCPGYAGIRGSDEANKRARDALVGGEADETYQSKRLP